MNLSLFGTTSMPVPKRYLKPNLKPYFKLRYRLIAFVSLLVVMTLQLSVMSTSARAETVRLLALGDSLTAGYGLAQEDSFPARLQAALREQGHDVEIINAGVSGDTTTGGRARLDWALGDNPHAVILALGANDGLRAIDPALTRDNLDQMLAVLTGQKLPVLLVGMLAPPNLGDAYANEFNAIYPQLSEKYDVELYPFFLEGVALDLKLNQADGIHPNEQGVAVIVERMQPYVVRLVEKVQSQ